MFNIKASLRVQWQARQTAVAALRRILRLFYLGKVVWGRLVWCLDTSRINSTAIILAQCRYGFQNAIIPCLKCRCFQASFLNKKLNIDGKRINLAIWDTAGQEKFHALGPIYYRSSNGAVLVYDITDEDSFQKVKNWVKELRKMLGSDICLVIAGNKTDLEKDRHVSLEEAES